MRHALGYTPGEIARTLDLPRGTVNSRLRRALDRLADAAGARWSLSALDELLARPPPRRGRRPASGRCCGSCAEYERAAAAAARRPRRRRVAALAAAGGRAARRALSPPGEAVADWVRSAVGLRRAAARGRRCPRRPAALRRAAARLVGRRGVDRRAETGSGGGSARGAGRRGRRTGASCRVEGAAAGRARPRAGNVRWSLRAPRPVTGARWSPSGFRVAYRAGPGPARGRRRRHRRPPARRRRRSGRCSVAARRARTCSPTSGARTSTCVDVDTGRRLARIRAPPRPRASSRGRPTARRLYVNLHRSIAIYDARGRRTGRLWMPGRQTVTTFVPAAQRLARRGRAARRQRRARSR